LKEQWDFLDKKGFQPWSDLLKFKAEISLQQGLHFSDTKALHLWSYFYKIQAKKNLEKMVRFFR